ncbi:MAG: hypothetical protein FWC41_07740 [Firmicutes bacterium]|nr:hypothetical protein [Bacillota bacterium]MCL2312362.1 hypothetical protein [Bacillota bacterium]
MEITTVILNKVKEQEKSMIGLMNSLEKQNKKYTDSRLFNLYVGKMFGMLEILEELKIDSTEFHWIYKYGI